MKSCHWTLSVSIVCLLAGPGWSADDQNQPRRPDARFFQRLLKEFDADGDGRLNEAERAKARRATSVRGARSGNRPANGRPGQGRGKLAELLKRFDKNGDGRLSEVERAAARQAASARFPKAGAGRPTGGSPQGRAAFLKRFDRDGDGKLSPQELAAARAEGLRRGGGGFNGRSERRPVEKPDKGRVDKTELLDKFDTDGDGKLTGAERAAALKAFQDATSSS